MEARTGRFVGQSIGRREDRRLLRGCGRFIADITIPGMLHVGFVRSPLAHARIRAIRTDRAVAAAGVVAVLTGADIRDHLRPIPGMQNRPPKAWREAVEHVLNIPDQPILANGKVCHVGEPLAVVVATDPYCAGMPWLWLRLTLSRYRLLQLSMPHSARRRPSFMRAYRAMS
jgi:aerobic carbon-monoxide dehydrogenase large subunit